MRILRTVFAAALAGGMALSAAAPAAAFDQAGPIDARLSGRAVLICAADAATRRSFAREHGAAPVFITADEALRVRPSDPAWNAPRCMTEREYARLRDAAAVQARVP
ncbi:hypothetical protein [uncultured Brevundimonas sp.]|uniref:hypothetical protein n=1 Tax=uncultured Brevundimonas sp. TaxID=213418 RepID=UPI00262D1437|nr:hypothetical protein [uncultured Brevundimonas sp.]